MKRYPIIRYQLLSKDAYPPTRGTSGSSGLDVYTPKDISINPREDILIPLDIRFEIPFGWDCVVHNKSGVSTKKKLIVGAHLIDSDYRGNCHAHLFNISNGMVFFKRGDKIAQLVIREVWMGELEEVKEIIIDTIRGDGGFGSTGK